MTARLTPWLAAALAEAWLVFMIMAGDLPGHGHYHQAGPAAGLLAADPARVRQVSLTTSSMTVQLIRTGSGWQWAGQGSALGERLATALEAALTYTWRDPPVRQLAHPVTHEALRAAGLVTPALSLGLEGKGGSLLQLSIGGKNADGVLRYARREPGGKLLLLSGFLGEAWDNLAAGLLESQPVGGFGDSEPPQNTGIRDP